MTTLLALIIAMTTNPLPAWELRRPETLPHWQPSCVDLKQAPLPADNDVIILQYSDVVEHYAKRKDALSPYDTLLQHFIEHVTYFKVNKYQTLTMAQLEALLCGRQRTAPRTLVLTFDGGLLNHWHLVQPVLRSVGFHASFYVTPELVGSGHTRPRMDWKQLKKLDAEALFEVYPLIRANRRSPSSAVRREMRQARRDLIRQLGGRERPYFAWQHANLTRSLNNKAARVYRLGFSSNHENSHLNNLLNIPRLRLGRHAKLNEALGTARRIKLRTSSACENNIHSLYDIEMEPGWREMRECYKDGILRPDSSSRTIVFSPSSLLSLRQASALCLNIMQHFGLVALRTGDVINNEMSAKQLYEHAQTQFQLTALPFVQSNSHVTRADLDLLLSQSVHLLYATHRDLIYCSREAMRTSAARSRSPCTCAEELLRTNRHLARDPVTRGIAAVVTWQLITCLKRDEFISAGAPRDNYVTQKTMWATGPTWTQYNMPFWKSRLRAACSLAPTMTSQSTKLMAVILHFATIRVILQ